MYVAVIRRISPNNKGPLINAAGILYSLWLYYAVLAVYPLTNKLNGCSCVGGVEWGILHHFHTTCASHEGWKMRMFGYWSYLLFLRSSSLFGLMRLRSLISPSSLPLKTNMEGGAAAIENTVKRVHVQARQGFHRETWQSCEPECTRPLRDTCSFWLKLFLDIAVII